MRVIELEKPHEELSQEQGTQFSSIITQLKQAGGEGGIKEKGGEERESSILSPSILQFSALERTPSP